MGSQPAARSGIPNGSAPALFKPAGSPLLMTVVGTPVFTLRILPNCHPPTAAFPKPPNDFGEGTAHRTLMEALWATLKSETPRSAFGAKKYKELSPLPNVSPAMVEELSSIDFAKV